MTATKFSVLLAAACVSLQGDPVQVRLLSPLASYSPAGTKFEARVLGPVLHTAAPTIPAGTLIRGQVRTANSVRFGIRHERARLELSFLSCERDGAAIPCDVKLLAVDNAREAVKPNNRIQGILAASHPHGWFNGIWFRPARTLAQRSVGGFVGTAGLINTHLVPNPIGSGVLMASRFLLLRLPDPEIELPAGSEFVLEVESDGHTVEQRVPEAESSAVTDWAASLPFEITRPDGDAVQDVVNFVFTGSKDEIESAFQDSGWAPAEARSRKSIARTYGAFARMHTNPTAPVSQLEYGGRPPDLVFQKSLNCISKRHHIRLWQQELAGETVWIGAATHDTGIGFDVPRVRFTHRIDPEVDKERSKILNDLTDAGCVSTAGAVKRPGLSERAAASTDGDLYLIGLRSCISPRDGNPALERLQRRIVTKCARRVVLETRYYLTRGNVFYWAFRTARWGVSSYATN